MFHLLRAARRGRVPGPRGTVGSGLYGLRSLRLKKVGKVQAARLKGCVTEVGQPALRALGRMKMLCSGPRAPRLCYKYAEMLTACALRTRC